MIVKNNNKNPLILLMHLGSSLKNNRLVLARSNVLSVFIGICGIMCRIFIGADAVGRKQNPVTCDAGVHP
ncbi:MAG: hypothetical protein KDI43_09495, partial [Gammaproteobacteria bacterium]|nr:hypothetical protein [Gammaproteobacteria bacterium]